ncbi:MAG: glutathione S-transferase N-terminal domain-containing protein [Rhizomicrobium sp.]
MKLYYSPGACSLSPHIVAEEAGIALEYERVDIKAHKTASGEDFYAIAPKGYVPALLLDDGTLLSEGPAVVQYLADLKPGSGLLPPVGDVALPGDRMADLRQFGDAQGLYAALQPRGVGRGQAGVARQARQELRVRGQGTGRQELPDRRDLHRRRRLFHRDDELVDLPEDRGAGNIAFFRSRVTVRPAVHGR